MYTQTTTKSRNAYRLSYWEIIDIVNLLGGKATKTQILNFCKKILGNEYDVKFNLIKALIASANGWLESYIAYVKYENVEIPILDFYFELNVVKYRLKVTYTGYTTMFEKIEKGAYKTKTPLMILSLYMKNRDKSGPRENIILTQKETPEPKATILFKIPIDGHEIKRINSILIKNKINNLINESLFNPEEIPKNENILS